MSDQKKDSRILIVDDTVKNIQVLGTVLKGEGYQINVAQNGKQALEMVQKVTPDLILLDVMMPEMDGFETCKHLKDDPGTREIPVIFLTAKVETEDIVTGFELGAIDYVTKPFNTTELLARVDTHLSLYHLKQKLEQLVEERTSQLQHRVRELDGRDRLVHLQMSSPDLEEVYQEILQVTEQVLKIRQGVIYRPTAAGAQLELVAALGLSTIGVFQTQAQLAGEAEIDLADRDSLIAQTFNEQSPLTGEGQEAIVPILYNEKCLGVLWVDTLEQGELDRQAELDSLWRLGQEAALAIRAAQLTEDLEIGEVDVSGLLGIED
jgi:DNA-binding response OmpR family regulator